MSTEAYLPSDPEYVELDGVTPGLAVKQRRS